MMRMSSKLLSVVLLMALIVSAVSPAVFGSSLALAEDDASVRAVVSQAGYSKEDMKLGSVVAKRVLQDETYEVVRNGTDVVHTGTLNYEGKVWGEHVYTLDFSSLQETGDYFVIRASGAESPRFSIDDNIWLRYRDEMTAFYRSLRASVDTSEALPDGYTDTPLSPKAYHEAGHMDDAWDKNNVFEQYDITLMDGTRPEPGRYYDLTGGHYDAGDYGKYGGNQWVGGQLALAYLRHSESPHVQFDYDGNGVPDIIEEVRVATEYILKFVHHFDGALFDIPEKGGFAHPKRMTDGIPLSPEGNPDDRTLGRLSVGGSAKAAGVMAAASRAYSVWRDNAGIVNADVDDFIDRAAAGAVQAYEFVIANEDKHHGGYHTNSDTTNPLLWAEVQLYLLTGESGYYDSASQRIAILEPGILKSTNYWDVRPIAIADFYPVADEPTRTKIRQLLRTSIDYFMSSANDTPYGVLNEFSNFGVNEPHVSYVGDLIRYYELFGDPEVLAAAKKGLYWVFGNNPWNTSWVSGIGENHVNYLHSRYDTEIYSSTNPGIVIPGAMVGGPNMKDPTNHFSSVNPWYEDRTMAEDGVHQWRYNEFSISIQAGLFYAIMALSALDEPSAADNAIPSMPILSPRIGDRVTGDVNVIVASEPGVSNVRLNGEPMQQEIGVWSSTLNTDSLRPYGERRARVTGVWDGNRTVTSNTHFTAAPPLPSPQQTSLFDDFGGNGVWGSQSLAWMNWWTQGANPPNTTYGSYARETVEGRTVGKLTHNPSSPQAQAKFQPWHYKADWSGYRFLYVTLKNSGRNPDIQFKVQVNGRDAGGGFRTVTDDWTTLKIDLNQLAGLNKGSAELSLWLRGGAAAGDVWIDDIHVGNDAEGTAPILSELQVSHGEGDERTAFHFAVTYTDADNDMPYAVQLVMDGVVHNMIEADLTDKDVTDGKQYVLTRSLVRGPHQYYVRTTDTHTDVVRSPVHSGLAVTAAAGTYDSPPAPGQLHALSTTSTSITLAWTPHDDDREVAGYGVYKDGILIDQTDRSISQYTVTGLEPGEAYQFYVRAHSDTLQHSESSNVITVPAGDIVILPSRYPAQYATGANERKSAVDGPGNASDTPLGWGKIWRSASLSWNVSFPETGEYEIAVRAYGESAGASMALRLNGQLVAGGSWQVGAGWHNYTVSLGTVEAGTHVIQLHNNNPAAGINVNVAHADIVGTAPSPFALTAPINAGTVDSSAVLLDWTQSISGRAYAPFGAQTYTVVVADNAQLANPIVEETGTGTTFQVSGLENQTTYYWQVTARNDNGSTHSDVFSFMVGAGPEPGIAYPARYPGQYARGMNERKGPTDWPGTPSQTPQGWGKIWRSATANWTVHFPEDGEYEFTVRAYGEGSDASFTVMLNGQRVPDAAWNLRGSWAEYKGSLGEVAAGTHTIGIYNNSPTAGSNADIAYIDIYGAAPGPFALTSPANGAELETAPVVLDWTQSIAGRAYAPFGADEYTLLVADNAALDDPIVHETVTATTYQVDQPLQGTTYYWQVIAHNGNASTHSDLFRFTFGQPQPAKATLTGPERAGPGEEIEVTAGVEQLSSGFTVLRAVVEYDPDQLALATELQADDTLTLADGAIEALRPGLQVLGSGIKPNEGQIMVILASTGGAEPIAGDGELFRLRGAMKPDARGDTARLLLPDLEFSSNGMLNGADTTDAVAEIAIIQADRAELGAAIDEARSLHSSAVEGSSPGQYPQGSKADLAVAISAATAAYEAAGATQAQLNEALAALNAAVNSFRGSVIPSEPADRTELAEAVEAALALHGKAVAGTKIGQYPAEAKSAFLSAIRTAEAVRDNSGATQTQVNETLSALEAKQSAFRASLITLKPGETTVTIVTLSIMANYYGAKEGDPGWSGIEPADLFDEKEITIRGLAAVARMIIADWLHSD